MAESGPLAPTLDDADGDDNGDDDGNAGAIPFDPLELEEGDDADLVLDAIIAARESVPNYTATALLAASNMLHVILDFDTPGLNVLKANGRYARSMACMAVVDALIECAQSGNRYMKGAVLLALHMARADDAHRMVHTDAHHLKGDCGPAVADACLRYTMVAQHNCFILCQSSDGVIRTWCNPERAPFHWLVLDALCRSFQGLREDTPHLNKDAVWTQFAVKAPLAKECFDSLFNELEQ